MTFQITMPSEEDLQMLPIVDLTPASIWHPSEYNYTGPSLSFVNSFFDLPCLTQQVNMTSAHGGGSITWGEHNTDGLTRDTLVTRKDPQMVTGEQPDSDEVFLDVLDTGEHPNSLDDLFFFDPSDAEHPNCFVGCPFHLSLEPEEAIDSHVIDHFLTSIIMMNYMVGMSLSIPLLMFHALLHGIMPTNMSNTWVTNPSTLSVRLWRTLPNWQ